ncbi:hypothetical protein SH1V18_29490 [Vallitalea longa]|uniref:Uncharacterized protein n=1 Tax=Vallitalea longa TaxID=2936439 RepID=A0A9W6DH43_9FIRM|nr:hypothetical protein [Vallitalea longa]GKX30469.1 hypothetical protein SH1V18_29490 [Vallitalea longa]
MGKLCRKYITISGILLIYAICLPSAFVSHANIIQVQNNFTLPIRTTGQWKLEQVLGQSVIKQLENKMDKQINNKEKLIHLYELIQNYLSNKVENHRFICMNHDNTYNPIRIDNDYKFDLDTGEIYNNTNQIVTTVYVYDNVSLEKYFKDNYKLCRNGNYIKYKVKLNKMNDKDNPILNI